MSPGSHPSSPSLSPEVQEGRGRVHAWSKPKVPGEQQWDAEA